MPEVQHYDISFRGTYSKFAPSVWESHQSDERLVIEGDGQQLQPQEETEGSKQPGDHISVNREIDSDDYKKSTSEDLPVGVETQAGQEDLDVGHPKSEPVDSHPNSNSDDTMYLTPSDEPTINKKVDDYNQDENEQRRNQVKNVRG